jgi:hypothetical protein
MAEQWKFECLIALPGACVRLVDAQPGLCLEDYDIHIDLNVKDPCGQLILG